MSESLRDLVARACRGRTAFLGIGAAEREDDAAGVRCAALLLEAGVGDVFVGATTPEQCIPAIRDGGYDTIVLLDAVDAGIEPGSVLLCDAQEIESRFPQISTHKLSASLLARLLTDGNDSRVWLLGIAAGSIAHSGAALTGPVDETVRLLARCIEDNMHATPSEVQEHLCI